MKAVFLLLILMGSVRIFLSLMPLSMEGRATTPIFLATTDTINYKLQIQPVLEKRCTPCHFAGGKMYERMPFDKSQTIIGFEPGVLKRIREEKENALVKKYIHQQKAKKNISKCGI